MKPASRRPCTATIVQHALDNGVNGADYIQVAELSAAQIFRRPTPDPCRPLPRQFGYWFHTGPGFADADEKIYGHRLLSTTGACVLGREGVVVYKGNWLDTMSLNYVRTDSPDLQFTHHGDSIVFQPPARCLDGRYLLGFNAGHDNYAHFVTDQLPVLYHYRRHFMDQGVRLLMPAAAASYVGQYLRLLGIADTAVEYVGNEVVEVAELIHANVFSFNSIPASVPKLLADFQRDHLPPVDGRKRRIFVSRRDTVVRTLLNEQSVCALLERYGFEIVVPGELSVVDQIDTFRSADWVVGVHGAALANIAYCRPGTSVIEIFPEYTVSSHFWMLASQFGLRYGVLFGTSFDQDEGLVSQAGSWNGPFVVSEDSLESVFKEASLRRSG